jgi:glutamate-1-semialdehyde 2,1-aminomutase
VSSILAVDTEVDALIASESEVFVRRQPRSTALIAEAARSLAGGATSNWQIAQPQAVWMSHGHGSHVWDVDGNEYVDMHGGYGAAIAGHGHPAIVEAVSRQVSRGTHFAQPTEDAIWVAEELKRRFGLPLWRFANSGTEATMDAIHLMRALAERDLVIKVEGCYHGHHDSVQVSVLPEPEEVGPADAPYNVPGNTGIPQAVVDLIVVVPFNDLGAVERALAAHRGQIAGMILEPIMMNAGIIPPEDGYLAGLKELLHAEDAYLTFDEVKTGFTTGPGGATGRYGVTPDIVCLAKALGGGISVAAIGGVEEVMSAIADGRYEQVGTFNGNPLAMAAARASARSSTTLATRTSTRWPRGRARASRDTSPPTGCRGTWSAWGPRDASPSPVRRCATTATSSRSTTAGATCTGSCSTMGACSSRRGARSSSGCCRCSTPRQTSTCWSPTSAS